MWRRVRLAFAWSTASTVAITLWGCGDEGNVYIINSGGAGGAAGSAGGSTAGSNTGGVGGGSSGSGPSAGGSSAGESSGGSSAGSAGDSSSGGSAGGAEGGAGGVTAGAGGSSGGGAGGSAGSGGGPAGLPFFEDFESGSDGWMSSPASTTWTLVSDGSTVYQQSIPADGEFRSASAGDYTWTDVSLEARVKILSFADATADSWAAICTRFISDQNHYCFTLRGDGSSGIRGRINNVGSWVDNQALPEPATTNVWYTVRFTAVGSMLTTYQNGVLVTADVDPQLSMGRVALATYKATAVFDDVSVTAP